MSNTSEKLSPITPAFPTTLPLNLVHRPPLSLLTPLMPINGKTCCQSPTSDAGVWCFGALNFRIHLHGQDLFFNPPTLDFTRSNEALFVIIGLALQQKEVVLCRSGFNVPTYSVG